MIRESAITDLETISTFELQSHASKFINKMTLAEHIVNFDKPDITYLTIVDSLDEMAGYFILATNYKDPSVEFRRVVIDTNKRGIGQHAITSMEQYCRSVLKKSRIWLDVYADNEIGIHIYSKLGYKFDRETRVDGRILKYYSKTLTGRGS